MVLTRYQIRNEYGLADKEFYQAPNKEDDAEALLEAASTAGLVGVLRQLGDLAEFAAEIFHCLHEELKTTASRGYGLAMRLQQLEADFPSIEIPILSQIDHSTFFYESGLKRHYNLQTEENLISPCNLPHCIMDSYEECRGPPQLFLLDKFDVDGSGSCLKRYSDPSLLKTITASAIVANKDESQRPRKPNLQKKGSYTTSGETSGDSRISHAKLHQLFFLEHVENKHVNPEFNVKLKKRLLNAHPINSSPGTSYMENFLKNSSPYCERVHKTLDQSCPAIKTEVAVCSVQEDLPMSSMVDTNSGDTVKYNEKAMESIPNDERVEMPFVPHEVSITEKSLPNVEGWQRSSSVNLCSKVNNDAYAPAFTELKENIADSDEKVDIQQCLSIGCCIQKQDQGQENLLETGLANLKTISIESRPTEDGHVGVQGSPFKEALTCNEKFVPSCITEVEALHPLYEEALTSLNDQTHKSVLSKDLIHEGDCLDMSPESRVSFSTSLHETPQADPEITPPLPPLPPTQWWMGKLVKSTEESRVEAASICAQTTLDKPSRAPDERSLSAVNEKSDTYMHDEENILKSLNETTEVSLAEEVSAGGLEGDWRTEAIALKWFSQNLTEHTTRNRVANPHPANLKEESQLGNPLETELPQTLRDNNSYDQDQTAGNLEKDKDSPIRGLDQGMLKKVYKRTMTQVVAGVDENDSLLEIIRSKSFNLRPAYAVGRPNFQVDVPKPNSKVAAILEKANTLRQAMAGSDDEHDLGNWSE